MAHLGRAVPFGAEPEFLKGSIIVHRQRQERPTVGANVVLLGAFVADGRYSSPVFMAVLARNRSIHPETETRMATVARAV